MTDIEVELDHEIVDHLVQYILIFLVVFAKENQEIETIVQGDNKGFLVTSREIKIGNEDFRKAPHFPSNKVKDDLMGFKMPSQFLPISADPMSLYITNKKGKRK